MARVTDYASLSTALTGYLHRADIVTAGVDYFIQEVEEEVNSRVRVRRMLTTVTPTVSAAGVVTLPSDFGGWKRFQVRDGAREWDLELKSAEETTDVSSLYTSTGVPQALITNGATSQIWPFTNGTYTFAGLYYAQVPALTSGATTNWLITNFPMVYLYGCLAAARAFAQDDPRFPVWVQRADRAIRHITMADAKDLDARSNAIASPDTSLFRGSGSYDVLSDSSR